MNAYPYTVPKLQGLVSDTECDFLLTKCFVTFMGVNIMDNSLLIL